MSVRQPIAATSFFLLLLTLFSVFTHDVAGAQERWPPWQSYSEAEDAARKKALRRPRPRADAAALKREAEQFVAAGQPGRAASPAMRLVSELRRTAPDTVELAQAYELLAQINIAQKLTLLAENNLKSALAIREKLPGQPGVAVTRESLAKVYETRGKTAEAQKLRNPAVPLTQRGPTANGRSMQSKPAVRIGQPSAVPTEEEKDSAANSEQPAAKRAQQMRPRIGGARGVSPPPSVEQEVAPQARQQEPSPSPAPPPMSDSEDMRPGAPAPGESADEPAAGEAEGQDSAEMERQKLEEALKQDGARIGMRSMARRAPSARPATCRGRSGRTCARTHAASRATGHRAGGGRCSAQRGAGARAGARDEHQGS